MKKKRIILLLFISFLFLFFCKKLIFKDRNTLININDLSQEFIDDYFKEISNVKNEDVKDNMLIVISNNKIKDSYGAKNVIEAPNNQYILQYGSNEEKTYALSKLKDDSRIKSVNENDVYKTEDIEYNSWGVEKMSMDYASNVANTNSEYVEPVSVAIIDTGCDMSLFNKYYSGKIVEMYNVLTESTTEMSDTDGHGTHIAGTIAESTPNNVKILPIKASSDGSFYLVDIIAAINYITYYKKADVINMSFGGYGYNEALDQAIEAAKQKNIISVAAAGNDNVGVEHYPSSLTNTISIASVDADLNKSTFSNYGSSITFTAPGTAIKSIMGKNASIAVRNGNNEDDDHETISGTSMATPHAVSAVAILKSYNKDLTFDNVIEILKSSSIDLGEKGWDQYYGNGLISFKNVEFCDGEYCDEFGIYKDSDKIISDLELEELVLTNYNYYSITNILGSKINVIYADGTNEIKPLHSLKNIEILNYDATKIDSQTVTFKLGNIVKEAEVMNPSNYESGWEYRNLSNGNIEITGYKDNGLEITKLYVPEKIDSKYVEAFADDYKFIESSDDFEFYEYLNLPSSFNKIGNYSLYNSNIKVVNGTSTGVVIGNHALESSSIEEFNIPIIKVGDYGFKDCFNLLYVDIIGEFSYTYGDNKQVSYAEVGEYAFYNCKKLLRVDNSSYDIVYVNEIGKYAFYNCVSLSRFTLTASCDIEEYAFYNTFLLFDLDLYNSYSVGKYAFYGSGISNVNFSINMEGISESSFENCSNLKKVSFSVNGGRIEKRAFWNSGVETIFLGDLDYIADDAFGYTSMKSDDGIIQSSGKYKVVKDLGIVENDNKLIVGFTNANGYSNTKIPDYITEIGDYAFTGNNNLKKIVIPSSVTLIGKYAFKDCYQLSEVYLLGKTINFGDESFKREHDGEIVDDVLNIYVYKDSETKQLVKNNNLNYRHIDPDEIVVSNYENSYKALSQVDWMNLGVKLIYHEEVDREEELTMMNYVTETPISPGVGFNVTYQDENAKKFLYGDTYFVVNAKNIVGYLVTKKVNITVEKETPNYTVPTGLTGSLGQKLSEITLPDNFEWMDGSQIINKTGEVVYKAKFIPSDTNNYEIVENIEITINVESTKTIIIPEINVKNKVYDGSVVILPSSITISNMESTDYSIINSISDNANAGKRKASVKIKLSDDKFKDYSFDNYLQEKVFTVDFDIIKAKLDIVDKSNNVTVKYDGFEHSADIRIESEQDIIIKYMDENKEYTLDEVPMYKDIGNYSIKYKVYIDDNFDEYYGEKKLTIEEVIPYTINNYGVDEDNKYIFKVKEKTKVNDFTANIILGYGYGINVDTKEVDGNEIIYTGGKTKITKGINLYIEYTNVVLGDNSGDGQINSADLLRVRKHLLNSLNLTDIYYMASDVDSDGDIDSADLLKIRQHLLGKIKI